MAILQAIRQGIVKQMALELGTIKKQKNNKFSLAWSHNFNNA